MKPLTVTRYQSDNLGNDTFTFSNKKVIKVCWIKYQTVIKVPKKYLKIISTYFKDAIDFINSNQYTKNLRKSFALDGLPPGLSYGSAEKEIIVNNKK